MRISEVNGMLLSPKLLEDIMTTLLEEDGIFGSYTDARYLKQVVGVCIVLFVAIDHDRSCTFWLWLVSHLLFSIRCLRGAHVLNT